MSENAVGNYNILDESRETPASMAALLNDSQKDKYKSYPRKAILGISITVMVLGSLSVVFGISDIILYNGTRNYAAFVAGGIWGGCFFILVGSFGLTSAKFTTKCWIVTTLVMSIIGAVVSVGPLTSGSIGWAEASDRLSYNYGYYRPDALKGSLAINIMIVFMSVTVGILLILTSSLACYGLCCGKNKKLPIIVAGQIHYINGQNGEQQMVIIPINADLNTMARAPAANPTNAVPYRGTTEQSVQAIDGTNMPPAYQEAKEPLA